MLELMWNGNVHYRVDDPGHPDVKMWLNQMNAGQANGYVIRGTQTSSNIESTEKSDNSQMDAIALLQRWYTVDLISEGDHADLMRETSELLEKIAQRHH